MKCLYGLLIALIGTFAIIQLVRAQDQQGFINLDCGLPDNEPSPYTEPQTGLKFLSDAGFIQTGKSGRVQNDQDLLKPYKTLRYFPEGVRNCYDLNVTKNTNYLITARFRYGNYDGLNYYPKFDLYLGPNIWNTIEWFILDSVKEEIIHVTRSESLQICLVKTDNTTPIISSLELRPLRNEIYTTQSGSLRLLFRRFFSNSVDYIRHPYDVHDRQWLPYMRQEWTPINTTLNINTSSLYDLPKAALMTGATPTNPNAPLTINLTMLNREEQVYLFTHFAEIQTNNGTREFDFYWNGNYSGGSYSPRWLQADTRRNTSPLDCKDYYCSLQLVKTRRSTLPPLLNAMEAFTVIHFPQSGTDQNDVAAMKNIKDTYRLSRLSWQGDPCVPRQFMWDDVNCSYVDTSTPPTITSLNLSWSGLTGTIASSFQNLTHLQVLDLSSNNLIGGVPEFLANMKSLTVINLSHNKLSGKVPQALIDRQQKGLELILEGNPKLCNSTSCAGKEKQNFIVPVVASIASVVAVTVVLVLILVFRKKKASSVKAPQPTPSLPEPKDKSSNLSEPSILRKKRRFSYSEVIAMTDNFQRVLGKGGFGFVYHGYLNDTEQVAVKMLSQASAQGHKEFKTEVELLLRVHHVNLVSLVGYCDEEDHLALIYEYMPNGDLKQHLSGKHNGFILSWASRLRIAVDAALGLEYLHTGCKPPMVHRDVKSTNILLNEHFHAKIADFGLSRSFPLGGETHVSTVVAGTPGYLDPEYYQTNWLTEKSDVYSFGIVLLEIITNQPVIDQAREKPYITEWLRLMLTRGDIESIIDAKLRGDYDTGSVWKAVELAMSCVNPSSTARPNMSSVVHELKECLRSENSRTGGSRDMESKSSVELSLEFNTEVFPKPR